SRPTFQAAGALLESRSCVLGGSERGLGCVGGGQPGGAPDSVHFLVGPGPGVRGARGGAGGPARSLRAASLGGRSRAPAQYRTEISKHRGAAAPARVRASLPS